MGGLAITCTANSVTNRPIIKLYPMEMTELINSLPQVEQDKDEDDMQDTSDESFPPPLLHPSLPAWRMSRILTESYVPIPPLPPSMRYTGGFTSKMAPRCEEFATTKILFYTCVLIGKGFILCS